MTTVSLSTAKAKLSEIADEVDRTHDRVEITKNGRPYVVLMSVKDLESLDATLELLSDPEAMERVREAQEELDAGGGITGEEMAVLMEQRLRRSSRAG